MPSLAPTELPAIEAQRLWREITGEVREACILRRQGRHQATTTILEHTLPPLIRSWSSESALPAAEAKARLNELFTQEQARIESHWLMARFLNEDTAAATTRYLSAFPAAPASPNPVPMWLPAIGARRIPLDDVADMIDAARDLDRCAVHAARGYSL